MRGIPPSKSLLTLSLRGLLYARFSRHWTQSQQLCPTHQITWSCQPLKLSLVKCRGGCQSFPKFLFIWIHPPPSSRMYRNMFIFLSRRRRSKCCSDNTPDGLGPLAQTLKNNGQQTARLAWAKWPRPFKVGGRNSQAGLGPVAQTFKFVTSKQAWSFTKSRPSGLDF